MKKKKLLKTLLIVVVVMVVVVAGLIVNFHYQVNKYLKTLPPEEKLLTEVNILMAKHGYKNKKAINRAIEKCKEIIEINPNSAKAYSKLGSLYRTKDMFKEAETSWKKAIELDPTYIEPRRGLENYYKTKDRYDEATKELKGILELDPNNQWAQEELENIQRGRMSKEYYRLITKDSKDQTPEDKERIAYLENQLRETEKKYDEELKKLGITDEDLIKAGKKYGLTKEDLGL